MTGSEKEIVRFIQDDIPLVSRPFKELAKKTGLSEKEIIILLKKWNDRGLLSRLSVLIRHQKAGFTANGMSVWEVPVDRISRVGQLMITFPQVGHCYRRQIFPGWPYNMFAMIHERSRDAAMQVAQKISLATGIKQYDVLFTEKEFKKKSIKYFINEIPMEGEKHNV